MISNIAHSMYDCYHLQTFGLVVQCQDPGKFRGIVFSKYVSVFRGSGLKSVLNFEENL